MHELARCEDFKAAAAVRDKLDLSLVDDEAQVLLANTELYTVISARDLERMKALWLPASYIQCIHPGEWSQGHNNVVDSWEKLFERSPVHRSSIAPEDVRVVVRGATATVVCSERITSKVLKRLERVLVATNIYRKVDRRWLLVHRHVSPTDSEADCEASRSKSASYLRAEEDTSLLRSIAQFQAELGDHRQGFMSSDLDEDEDLSDDDSETSDEEDDPDMEEILVQEEDTGMEAARDTVRALRRLSKEGRLALQAKTQLISDMLRNPGESMPERAHELLLANVPEEEQRDAWDDFSALIALEAKRINTRKAKGR